MQIPRRYDVFPSKVDTDSIPRLQPTFPLRDFVTYVPYLHAEKLKMYYYHVGYGRMLSDNMQRTLSSALSPSTEWRKKFDWNHANARLIIDWEANNPDRRCDTRLSFCSGNSFLVKTFFTFGKREVDPEEVHILQTTQAPLLFYLPRAERRSLVDSQPARSFHHEQVNFYNRYVLQPNSVYKIAGGTSYLLMTSVKSLFSLNRVTPELADRLESLWDVDYADPTSHTDYEGWRRRRTEPFDPYDKPLPSVMPLDYFVLPGKRAFSNPLPVAKRRKPAISKEPVFKQPFWKEPLPVVKEPPPVVREPPPVVREPLPEESLPVVKEPPPVQSPPTTSYADDFFNAMPDLTSKLWGQTNYYRQSTFDTGFQMDPNTSFQMDPSHMDPDQSYQMTPYQNESLSTQSFSQPTFDTSFQPLFDPTFQPEAFQPTFQTFDESVQIGDYMDFESLFSGPSESNLQELYGDLEQYLRTEGVV